MPATPRSKPTKGSIACGHPETAAAATEILSEGGNAFDAILAAFCAATVVEPVFCSLGGGGFLLAQPQAADPVLYDFFVQTPKRRSKLEDIDFYPILADFGPTTQEFHIGLGACATPGAIKGLFTVHDELATLPMTRIAAPAVRMAREGFRLREIDRFVFGVVGAVLKATPDSRAIFTGGGDDFPEAGSLFRQPALADTLEALALAGDALFYQGELGQRLVAESRDTGGQLSKADLDSYEVIRRAPLTTRYRDSTILTNPPPSSGGILIAFALDLLSRSSLSDHPFGGRDYLVRLARVMAATNQARIETGLGRLLESGDGNIACQRLLDPALLERYSDEVAGQPRNARGTTHMSVTDGDGNTAALTLSNGEGCGRILGDSGIMLNNMLGEEDLNPDGFQQWPEDRRISSMMAPSLARFDDGAIAALGSGGSNRIRTAILQVLINLIDYRRPALEAVNAPRIHLERGLASVEAGFETDARDCLQSESEEVMLWPGQSLFFGGVHAVTRSADGRLSAAGDPRRGGVGEVV